MRKKSDLVSCENRRMALYFEIASVLLLWLTRKNKCMPCRPSEGIFGWLDRALGCAAVEFSRGRLRFAAENLKPSCSAGANIDLCDAAMKQTIAECQ